MEKRKWILETRYYFEPFLSWFCFANNYFLNNAVKQSANVGVLHFFQKLLESTEIKNKVMDND